MEQHILSYQRLLSSFEILDQYNNTPEYKSVYKSVCVLLESLKRMIDNDINKQSENTQKPKTVDEIITKHIHKIGNENDFRKSEAYIIYHEEFLKQKMKQWDQEFIKLLRYTEACLDELLSRLLDVKLL